MTAPSTSTPADAGGATDTPLPCRGAARCGALSAWLHQHHRVQVGLLLATPLGWLVIVYLGSLFILLLNAFWEKDAFTGQVSPFSWSLDAFDEIASEPVYRTIALRTIGMAIAGHDHRHRPGVPDRLLHGAHRIAAQARRCWSIAVLMPLWAAYLVKVYAWRTILQGNGLVDWLLSAVRARGTRARRARQLLARAVSYLWLPYMIMPIYAGLERIPSSLLEASSDLGGRA